jgi:hypothetical protein
MSYFNKTQTNRKNKNNILDEKNMTLQGRCMKGGRAVYAFVDTWKRSRGSIADGVRDPACTLCSSQENLRARILAADSPSSDRRFPQLTITASYLAISDAAATCSGNGSDKTRGQQLCQYNKPCIVQRAEWAEDR